MKNLISMTEFVLEQSKIGMEVQSISHQLQNRSDRFEKIVRYSKFLKQKLEFWMFIPCKPVDGTWVVLEEPNERAFYTPMPAVKGKKAWNTHRSLYEEALREYQEAKERCYFECKACVFSEEHIRLDFENGVSLHCYKGSLYSYKNIEIKTLEDISYLYLPLTPTAQKQIGL